MAIVTGDDAALVIGRHGHTIDAIQHLVLAIVLPPGTDLERDVVVDAQGYRARRERRLREVATQAAEQAVSRNAPVALEPMSAAERKVVHTTWPRARRSRRAAMDASPSATSSCRRAGPIRARRSRTCAGSVRMRERLPQA